MDRVIKELELETMRSIHQALNSTLLGQEDGKFPRLVEKHMRIMIKKKFQEYLFHSRHGPVWKKIMQENSLDEREVNTVFKKIESDLSSLLKTRLRQEKNSFDVEKYIKDQTAIVKAHGNK